MWCIQNQKDEVQASVGLVLVGMHKEGYEQELDFMTIPEYLATLPPEVVDKILEEVHSVKRLDKFSNCGCMKHYLER